MLQKLLKLKEPIFFFYKRALFWNVWQWSEQYYNETTRSENRMDHYRFVRIGFEPKLYGFDESYYDGHTFCGIIFLGLFVGFGYSYEWTDFGVKNEA